MQRIENRLKTIHRLLAVTVLCGLFFGTPSTAQGFFVHPPGGKVFGILSKKIDKPQWRIGYTFGPDCPAAFRAKEAELEASITKALQVWLQPLRDRYPGKHFTDDFLFVQLPFAQPADGCFSRLPPEHGLDLYIALKCDRKGPPFATHGVIPRVCLIWDDLELFLKLALVHELGHAFGLSDTYVDASHNRVSTGGLPGTSGKHPASVMASFNLGNSPFYIAEDDKNGILWLYKYLYEDLPAGDCFFPDYVRVKEDSDCEPKYPLIFEVKQGFHKFVEMILNEDPTLDINARDSSGFTALHHAVQGGDSKIVKVLLAQAGIKANLLNTHKRTPAQLARILKQTHLAKIIEAHPTANWQPVAWDVAPKGKLTTTWGHLKKRY